MVPVSPSPLGRLLPRHASALVSEALADTRVVLVSGARQVGKSTLVNQAAGERAISARTLDRATERDAAGADPVGYVDEPGLQIIDEIQRVPDLLLAIKETVDRDPRPGRFLLTGSARLLGMRTVPDALPGRMETIELWPLSQGEIDGRPDGFVDAVFADGPDLRHETSLGRADYVSRVVRGGFPEAVARSDRRRQRFFDSYVGDLINRDVIQLSEIERGPEMRALVRMVAARSGQLLVPATMGAEVGLTQPTAKRYLSLLEEVYLTKRIPAWSRNLNTRATATPKVAMVDSGIAANLLGQDERRLSRPDSALGGLLEGFVTMELARQLTWSTQRCELFHYRTRDGVEVDIVLDNRQGQVVACDVKASATVRACDFAGIRHLRKRTGTDFVAGIILYTGERTISFGSGLLAMPIAALWEVG